MSLHPAIRPLLLPCLLAVATLPHQDARALDIRDDWQLLTGSDPLETTAAGVFRDEAAWRFNASLPAPRPESAADPARPALVIGTVATSALVAAEHARAPFRLDPAGPESFHVRLAGSRLYAVGATPKGAMNAAFRLLDRNNKKVDGADFAGAPNFRWRVGGNEQNQSPPPDWTHDDQARYYARHYINVVWGEKKRPPLPLEARRKYGLGLMAEIRFPRGDAGTRAWMEDPASRDALFSIDPAKKRKNLWSDPKGLRLVSPFAPAGRRWYLEQYKNLYRENPDLKILYNMFADYNVLPEITDSFNTFSQKPYDRSIEDTILEVLKIAREAVGPDSGIVPRAWLWQSFWFQRKRELAFMERLQKEGFGFLYNESGDSDNWSFRLNNFDDVALKTRDGRPAHGGHYLSLVSAGGDCESVTPAIGLPLPRVAAHKLALLAGAGARDFVLWWSGCEGWTYQPNLEAVAELVWTDKDELARLASRDFDASAPLLARLAERDFGPDAAPGVLEYYKKFDAALVTTLPLYKKPAREAQGDPAENGLHIYNWYQRLGTYTKPHPFKGVFLEPVTAAAFADAKRFRQSVGWGANDYALANYKAVLLRLKVAQRDLARLAAAAPAGRPRERLQALFNWSQLAVLLWESQYHHMSGFALASALGGETAGPAALRRALAPLTRESIRNTEALLALLPAFAPNMNLTANHTAVVENRGSRDGDAQKLRAKLAAMKAELASGE
ncbi:MAG: hypothetical protein LBI02_05815 [Opitutaceae bacterium]|jgi:hypothetical protein|nr:hypothetical protein [Opitutaceae bacterium]